MVPHERKVNDTAGEGKASLPSPFSCSAPDLRFRCCWRGPPPSPLWLYASVCRVGTEVGPRCLTHPPPVGADHQGGAKDSGRWLSCRRGRGLEAAGTRTSSSSARRGDSTCGATSGWSCAPCCPWSCPSGPACRPPGPGEGRGVVGCG